MKIQTIFYCAALLVAACACRQEEIQPAAPAPGEQTGPLVKIPTDFTASLGSTGTKTAVDMSTGRIVWHTDDPVMVSNGTDQVTLYIEQGGTTEAALYSLGQTVSGNAFYAIYPAEGAMYMNGTFQTVIPQEQTYTPGGFATETFPMVALCDKNRNFSFRNAASLLRIDTTGDLPEWESIYSVSVSADQFMAGPIAVQYSEQEAPLVECTDGYYTVTVSTSGEGVRVGEPIYVAVVPGAYENVRVRVTMTSGFTVHYAVEEPVVVERSTYKAITVPLEYNFTDLSVNGTANCYVITEPGTYRIDASVRGNGVTTSAGLSPVIEGAVSAKMYYTDGGAVLDGAPAFAGGHIYFTTAADELPVGTVLLSVLNENGEALWSWHLWFNPNVADVKLSNGQIWMNMNLGAHQVEFNSQGYNGFYYQWGRKDPFLQQNTGTKTDAKTLAPFVSGASRTDGSLENSIKNPHIFYGSYHPSGVSKNTADWSTYVDEEKVYDWWNANVTGDDQMDAEPAKTMFDPCPQGYHVPTYAEAKALTDLSASWDNKGSKVVEGILSFPTTSYRAIGIYQTYWEDPRSFFWTSTPYNTGDRYTRTAYRPYFTTGGKGINGNGIRSWGIQVRCISDVAGEPTPVFVPVSSVQLDKPEIELKVGETMQLTATVYPEDATDKTVLWNSVDKAVATVSDGLVQAVAPGTTTVEAWSGGKVATCTVKVSKDESGGGNIEDMNPEEW